MRRVGLWGAYDRENYGDVLFPRIARAMLRPRIPDLDLRVSSPLGYVGRNRFDDGAEPCDPLGTWSAERIDSLARDIDTLIIGGGEIVHDRHFELAGDYGLAPEEMERRQPFRFLVEGLGEHERRVPTAWHAVGVPFGFDAREAERMRQAVRHRAYLTVRDELSRDKLIAAGIEQEVVVVPDSVYAIAELFPLPALRDHVQRMREAGVFPRDDALVVQGSRSLLDHVDGIAEHVSHICRDRQLVPVLAEMGPIHGDGEFADAVGERLPEAVRLAPDTDLLQLTAAIATSAGFMGSSLHGNIVAAAYDRPGLFLDLAGQAKLEGQAAMLDAPERHVEDAGEIAAAFARVTGRGSIAHHIDHLRRRLDDHFDRLAQLAVSAAGQPRSEVPLPRVIDAAPETELERSARANLALAAQMAAHQAAFADHERDLRERIAALVDSGAGALARAEAQATARAEAAVRDLEELVGRLKEEVAWLQGIRQERDGQLEELQRAYDALYHRSRSVRIRAWFRGTGPGRAIAKLSGRSS